MIADPCRALPPAGVGPVFTSEETTSGGAEIGSEIASGQQAAIGIVSRCGIVRPRAGRSYCSLPGNLKRWAAGIGSVIHSCSLALKRLAKIESELMRFKNRLMRHRSILSDGGFSCIEWRYTK
jgi:hypothetical protein